MFRMNGTSRLSTWMCDAKPPGDHIGAWPLLRIPRQLLLHCSTSCVPAVVRPRHTVHPEHKRVLKEGTTRPRLPCRSTHQCPVPASPVTFLNKANGYLLGSGSFEISKLEKDR